MRNLGFCIIFFLTSLSVNAQVKSQLIANTALPKNITYKGKPVHAVKFQDKTGNYLALSTQTGEQPQGDDEEFKQAHLYAYVYQLGENRAPALVWQLHDFVTECNLDMTTEFVPGSLTFTDLDKNGRAEVWLAYRLACKGDVSPSELKIIMHEGSTKYAMRGEGKLKISNRLQPDGGVITSNDFDKATVVFSQHAKLLWNKYVVEVLK